MLNINYCMTPLKLLFNYQTMNFKYESQIHVKAYQQGMLTLDLSVLVLDIPNDAYTTLSRNLIGCSKLRQEYL